MERTRPTPSPSLSRLDELADMVRGAGLPVTLSVSGNVAALPLGVDLTAYRIVQEALTNALRHAPGSAASVSVARQDACLTVEVANTAPRGVIRPASGDGGNRGLALSGGHGLAGIAERVASCGGALTLGPTPAGGFTVSAQLPLT